VEPKGDCGTWRRVPGTIGRISENMAPVMFWDGASCCQGCATALQQLRSESDDLEELTSWDSRAVSIYACAKIVKA
jgi:hypothetical protein